MTKTDTKELQAKAKTEVASPAEQTQEGLVFTPAVDIFETENNITLIVDMPGVKKDDINIDLNENLLTLSGDVKPFEGAEEDDLLIEFDVGKFWRQFTIPEVIEQSKINAEHKDGVLRLTLPKVEKAQPRRIAVKAA